MYYIIACVAAFVIGLIIVLVEKRKMNNAVLQDNADDYVIDGSIDITHEDDDYITTTYTRVPLPKNKKS